MGSRLKLMLVRSFSTTSRPALRAAASGDRPRADSTIARARRWSSPWVETVDLINMPNHAKTEALPWVPPRRIRVALPHETCASEGEHEAERLPSEWQLAAKWNDQHIAE